MPTQSKPPSRRFFRVAKGLTALLLVALAVYLWTAPYLRSRAIERASFDQLVQMSKREPDNPRLFYQLGVRLRGFGQDGPAKAAFQRAATLDGDFEDAWLAWASTAGAMGAEQEAFAVLSNFATRHKERAPAHFALALFYRQQDAHGRAYDEALAATRADPKQQRAWRLAGIEAIELRRFDQASDALNRALSLDARDWRCRLALGNVLTYQIRPADALAQFREAAQLAPKEPTTLLGLGKTLLKQARGEAEVEEARRTLARAVELNPGYAIAQLGLGQALERQKNLPAARAALEEAARIEPDLPEAHFELRHLYQQLGDNAAAAREEQLHHKAQAYRTEKYNLLTRIYQVKDDAGIRLRLARLLAAHGETAAAAREYRRLVMKKEAESATAQQELAQLEQTRQEATFEPVSLPMPGAATTDAAGPGAVALQLRDADAMRIRGRLTEAERAYLGVLIRDPGSARAYEGLGITLDARGKQDDAFRALNRALTLDPRRAEAGFVLARLYFKAGFPDEAARRMEEVVKVGPQDARYWHALGVAYSRNPAHYAGAEKCFRRAVELAPANGPYRTDLADCEAQNHRSAEAENDYRKTLALIPDDADLLVRFGRFLLENRPDAARQQEAGQMLAKSVKRQAVNPYAHQALGRIALEEGKPDQAVEHLETSVQQLSGNPDAWYLLARGYDRLGKRDRAEQCRTIFKSVTTYRSTLTTTEGLARQRLKDPAIRLKLARLYASGGDYARALNQYSVCISLAPANSEAKQERDALASRLKSEGKMPAMTAFDGMLLASARPH